MVVKLLMISKENIKLFKERRNFKIIDHKNKRYILDSTFCRTPNSRTAESPCVFFRVEATSISV